MKIRKIISVLIIVAMISIIGGCGQTSASKITPMNSKKAINTSTEILELSELDPAYVDGWNQFAYHIFSEIDREENVFISPYSISMALSMIYNGADGVTRTEMAKLLGYDLLKDYTEEYGSDPNQYMNANSKLLIETLKNADSKVQIDIANSIWMDQDKEFKDTIDSSLLAPVRNYYNADIFQVDFKEDATLDALNDWVSKKTDGMINPFLDKFSNPEDLRLVLVNAIYFNGKWSMPFSQSETNRAVFHGAEANRNVDMMNMSEESFRYFSSNGMRGVEIPYGKESLVMDVLIPEDTSNSISQVYNALTEEEISEFLLQLDQTEKVELARLALPKFEMEYRTKDLLENLKALGMKDAFDEEKANFDLISEDLFISEISHMAKIQVEEWGTKAAAATAVMVEDNALIVNPLEFIVDVPFIFFIRDKDTGAILFMGEINQLG